MRAPRDTVVLIPGTFQIAVRPPGYRDWQVVDVGPLSDETTRLRARVEELEEAVVPVTDEEVTALYVAVGDALESATEDAESPDTPDARHHWACRQVAVLEGLKEKLFADVKGLRLRTHSPEAVEKDGEGRPYPCGAFVSGDSRWFCRLESDHEGDHEFVLRLASPEEPERDRSEDGHLGVCSGRARPPTLCGVCGDVSDDRHDAAWARACHESITRALRSPEEPVGYCVVYGPTIHSVVISSREKALEHAERMGLGPHHVHPIGQPLETPDP